MEKMTASASTPVSKGERQRERVYRSERRGKDLRRSEKWKKEKESERTEGEQVEVLRERINPLPSTLQLTNYHRSIRNEHANICARMGRVIVPNRFAISLRLKANGSPEDAYFGEFPLSLAREHGSEYLPRTERLICAICQSS